MEESKLTTASRVFIGSNQTTVEGKLEPSDSDDIVKILCVSSKAYIDSVEINEGSMVASGEITYNAIYINEEGNINSSSSTSPLVIKLEDDLIQQTDKPIWKVEVVETRVKSAQNNEVIVSSVVELCLDVIRLNEVVEYKTVNDNIKTKKESVRALSYITTAKANIQINEEENVKYDVNKILNACATVQLKNYFAGTGYFTVDGEVNVNITTICGEDKIIKCFDDSISFKEEIENEFIQKDDTVIISAYIKPEDIKVVQQEESEKNILNILANITLEYIILRSFNLDVIKDAYSTSHKYLLSFTSEEINDFMSRKAYKERIEGNLIIEDNEPRIAKILATNCGSVSVVKSYCVDGYIIVEGLANSCVVYETDEDDIPLASVQVETPFSIKLSNDYAKEGVDVFVKADMSQTSGKAKKGKEIEIDMEMILEVDLFDVNVYTTLKDIVLTEVLPKSDYALQVYVAAKGSTLWEIAKKLCTTEDVILSQNPTVSFPLEEATGIVYFISR